MQPTYMPWIGYFALIDSVDIFWFSDDIQFERRSWQKRNRIKVSSGNSVWLTVPIEHEYRIKINEVKIKNSIDWRHDHWQTIYFNYSNAQCFNDYANKIKELYQKEWENLCDMNIYFINVLASLLGIKMPRIIKTSDLKGIEGHKTDRILSILRKLDADEYASVPGSRSYIEVDKFKKFGINFYWFEYQHPAYPQRWGDFIPYLSALDLLFNTGREAINYIREGEKDAFKLDEG